MIKALITGASGVLGRRLLEVLKDEFDEIVVFSGDITNPEVVCQNISKCLDVTHVFHMAALVPTEAVSGNFHRALEINAFGSTSLFATLCEAKLAPWFCYVSTSHVYKPSIDPLSEDADCSPSSLYGLTKYIGELNLVALARHFGMPLAIARVFSYHDPLQTGTFLLPGWKKRVAEWDGHSELLVQGGKSIRDFSRGIEVAQKLKILADHRFSGCVNIGSGASQSVIDFLVGQFGDSYPFKPVGVWDKVVPDLTQFNKSFGKHQ